VVERSLGSYQPDATLPRDIASTSSRLILTRWVAGVAVVLATVLCSRVLGLPLPETPLVATGGMILLYNALFVLLSRRAYSPQPDEYLRRIRRLVILQVGLDWISMAVFLHLTGGVTSPGIPLFLIHMLMVTILLPGPSSYVYVALGIGAVATLAGLEAAGILAHYAVIPALPAGLYRDPIYAAAAVVFFGIAALATVTLAASIVTRLRERERQINALFQTTRAVSSTLSLPEVLQSLASGAAIALSSARASIRLLDETGERLTLVAAYGLSSAYKEKGPVEVSLNPLAREALAGRPVLVGNAGADDRLQYPREVLDEGIQSLVVVPIAGRNRPLGILRVYSEQANRFSAADAEFVMTIARQGAVAIENAMAHEALQRADQERAQFVRTVTHELRSPVGGAQSLLRVLLKQLTGELNDRQRDVIARVEARLNALMALINDLLALAASKTSGFQEKLEAVELGPALRAAVEVRIAEAAEKRVVLRFEPHSDRLMVQATADGLALVFDNLIGNAVKYTAEDGRVIVRIVRQKDTAVVTIADTGIGIPAGDMPRLWEEFFRAGNARKAGIVGTGLGLSISRRLVESYGGRISVQSVERQGTTFTVTLPLSPVDTDPDPD
jgi:signal transduction histidine kinase